MTEEGALGWEGQDSRVLAVRWGLPAVRLFRSVGSTNDVARRLAAEGAAAGTVVLSEEQVAGRGRAGRGWASPPKVGLWVSLIGAPPAGSAGTVTPLVVGLAVAAALDELLPAPGAWIKWPNDLWVSGRKLGGILCEASWQGGSPGPVIVGVGLNLLQRAVDFPPGVRETATSVALEAAGEVSRLAVADVVIPAIASALSDRRDLDPAALARRDLLRGRRVEVSDPVTGQALVRGEACGIAGDGSLRVRDESGVEHGVRSGTVRVV